MHKTKEREWTGKEEQASFIVKQREEKERDERKGIGIGRREKGDKEGKKEYAQDGAKQKEGVID